ncbi:MAG: hypothetical protein LBM77_11865 [Spirochaetaceae bacterium]|nr:hypothetical protein [Spirochaetaceae bacterium]
MRSLSKKLKTLAGSLGNISQKEGIVELQLQAGFDSELIADRICRTIPCIQVTTP